MSPPTSQTSPDAVQARVLNLVDEFVSELRGGSDRRVRPNDSLEQDLGIGSLERVELAVRLEQAFDVRLGDEVMVEAETPVDLVSAITTAGPAETSAAVPTQAAPAVTAPAAAVTLIDALEWHATRTPDRIHIHLREDDGVETPITYGALWEQSVAVANGLAARRIGQRETVAIMLRTEQAFFPTFLGTLLAGCIPVPLYPPVRANRIEEYAERQVGILRNAGARLLITFAEIERLAGVLVPQVPSLAAVVTPDALSEAGGAAGIRYARGARGSSESALIQYTSGSTGSPKGVLLSHANLLANIRAIEQGLGARPGDVAVSWLPLYHDMGLIGSWLGTMYMGVPLVLMSPLAFLARPIRWLRALHDHRGTLSPAPNFAYDLCSQRIRDDELEGLDLSSARRLLNGSEAVHPESLERFLKRFAPLGLKPEALCPVYGLAECSVALAVPPVGRGPRIDAIDRQVYQEHGRAEPVEASEAALRVVSCGSALPKHALRVVDQSGQPVADRRAGRVQFRGPSATAGYYRNPDATSGLIGADGWLETGDIGYLADGELFVTGRDKDIIIKGGRNLHPHEAEELASGVEGVRAGCVAAFGVGDPARGTERFVVVVETRQTSAATRQRIKTEVTNRITAALGVPPNLVVPAPPGAVLKTSSGKIRRAATRDAYLAGRLANPRSATAVQWARVFARSALARCRQWGARLLKTAFTAYVWLLLLLTAPPAWVLLAVGPRGRWPTRLIGAWTKLILAVTGCRLEVDGLDRAGSEPAVYVANHVSFLDPVVIMAALPADVCFAVKGRLVHYPLVGTTIRKAGHVTLDKSDHAQRIDDAAAIIAPLREGRSLFIFPEGTFTEAPGLLPFRLGAFRAAADTGRPVVPVAISGTHRVFPAGTLLVWPGRIKVTFGQPLAPEGNDWREIVRLRDAARTAIEDAIREE